MPSPPSAGEWLLYYGTADSKIAVAKSRDASAVTRFAALEPRSVQPPGDAYLAQVVLPPFEAMPLPVSWHAFPLLFSAAAQSPSASRAVSTPTEGPSPSHSAMPRVAERARTDMTGRERNQSMAQLASTPRLSEQAGPERELQLPTSTATLPLDLLLPGGFCVLAGLVLLQFCRSRLRARTCIPLFNNDHKHA